MMTVMTSQCCHSDVTVVFLPQGRSRPIRVLNRLTIMMSDASHIVSDKSVPEKSITALLHFNRLQRHYNHQPTVHACVFRDLNQRIMGTLTCWPCSWAQTSCFMWDSHQSDRELYSNPAVRMFMECVRVCAGGLHDVWRRHHLYPGNREAAFHPEEGASQWGELSLIISYQ